jgi:hypothetical protein
MGGFRVICFCVLLLWLAVGCGGSGGDSGGNDKPGNTNDKPVDISGAAQKGPFITGSSVTVNLLTESGQATTDTIITSTDNLGNFNFQLSASSLVQIRVDGYYFNEITGSVSNSPITLNAIYDTSVSDLIMVNVLTHLINNRVRFLIGQGNTASTAIAQAQSELVTALSDVLPGDSLPDFAQMSVYNLGGTNSEGNAYLLALSAIVYNYASIEVGEDSGQISGKLADTLNNLAADLEPDGVLDNAAVVSGLVSASTSLNPDQVTANLSGRSVDVLGEAIEVPDMNLFIDTDRDGVVNSVDNDDDGDGFIDAEDPNPYVFDNIPRVETFSVRFDEEPAIVYNDVEDSTLPTEFQTRIGAHFDQTRVVRGVSTPTPIIYLDQYQEDGTYTWLHFFLPAEEAGTYYIDDVTNVRYFSYTSNEAVTYDPRFNYSALSGSITISEYGPFGYAVEGSYDITLTCIFDDIAQCNSGDERRIRGEFVLARDEVQQFASVGSLALPVDLGGYPFYSVLSTINHPPMVYFGTNKNIVSPSSPSYYQFSVNPLNQYKVDITHPTGAVKLSVYGTSDFSTLLCESSVDPISCTVPPQSDTLYFSVSVENSNDMGAWFDISIEPASFNNQGAANNPIDITDQMPYFGEVGLGMSYYKFTVTPGSMRHFVFKEVLGITDFEVASDSSFTNIVCKDRINTYNNACNLSIDPGVSELFVRTYKNTTSTPAVERDGGYFQIDSWEITLPLYHIQVIPTPVDNTDACGYPRFYELDGTMVKGLHQLDYNDCRANGFNGNIPLEPGKTYNVEIDDSLTYASGKVDYYAIWFGLTEYAGTLQSITPDTALNEPTNDLASGAIPLGFETLYYDSFLSNENDYDWYTITIPVNGASASMLGVE